jgi:hypothetical protein
MGFFKDVSNGIGNVVKGNIKTAVNDFASSVGAGSSSGGGNTKVEGGANTPTMTVWLAYQKQRYDYYRSQGDNITLATSMSANDANAYVKTPEGLQKIALITGQVSSGVSSQGSTVGTILKDLGNTALGAIKTGITGSLGNAVGNGIRTVGENLGASDKAQGLQSTIGRFLGGTADVAWKDWLKKNWFYIVIPFGLTIWVLMRWISALKGGKRGRAKQGRKRF